MKHVKTLIITGLLTAGLAACSSDQTPTPAKLYNNVGAVPPTTTMTVTSLSNFKHPHEGQIVEKPGLFTTNDEVFDSSHNKLLIPRGATVSGIYMNDGTSCKILWKSVFANSDSNGNEENAVPINQETLPTLCNPDKNIKRGDDIDINFTSKGY